MNPAAGLFFAGRSGALAALLGALFFTGAASPACAGGLHPAEITYQQSQQAPYRDSGRIEVKQGSNFYIGTASYVRRYTGLTAGHVLYSPKRGFSTSVRYDPALWGSQGSGAVDVTFFAVLSGYQEATVGGDDTDAAFDQDMGYLIFNQPAANDEWATWSDHPDDLVSSGPFLLFGYAAQSFTGDELASVTHRNPYNQLLAPALYENEAYYTEGGMSGGPLYATLPDGTLTMAAINVAGTDYGQGADSLARAITPSETPLLLAAEYAQGIITGGVIRGPATVPAGGTAKIKTGLVFVDGAQVNNAIAFQYDADLKLVAAAPYKQTLRITKVRPGRYNVVFPADLPSGTSVTLKLLRTALPAKGQVPLQTLAIVVQ